MAQEGEGPQSPGKKGEGSMAIQAELPKAGTPLTLVEDVCF